MKSKYRNTSRRRTPWDYKTEPTPLETFIKSNYLFRFFEYKHQPIIYTQESELLNSYTVSKCNYCASTHFKKNGYSSNGVQRYLCPEWIAFYLDIFRYKASISLSNQMKIVFRRQNTGFISYLLS